MKKTAWISLLLALCLVTGCSPRATAPASSPLPEPEPSAQEKVKQESLPPLESSQPEEESTPEESKPLTPVEPDNTPPTSRTLKEVEQVTEEQVRAVLSTPLEELSTLDNTSIPWGPGVTSGEVVPSEPQRLQTTYGDLSARFVMPDSKNIYLSFDEGYELGYTPAILDTLKEKKVTAVFFVTLGYVKDRPDLIQRMIDEGHIVGNHSSSHPVGGMPTLSTLDMAKDMLYLHHYVKENFGYEMTLFRPPEGTFSVQSLSVAQALGYQSVFWSFAYNDWNPEQQMELEPALQTIVERSHPGAIYLLHAVSSTNTAVLGNVIEEFQAKGYTISDWTF